LTAPWLPLFKSHTYSIHYARGLQRLAGGQQPRSAAGRRIVGPLGRRAGCESIAFVGHPQ